MQRRPPVKPVRWIGSSHDDLLSLPGAVQRRIGYALYLAQTGLKAPEAKPLKGFQGAGIVEIVEDYDTNTYRVIYTVRFGTAIYVLHVFQKKSRQGRATAQHDLDLVRARLKQAEMMEKEYAQED